MATHAGVIKAIVSSFFFGSTACRIIINNNNNNNNNNNDLLTIFLHGSSTYYIHTEKYSPKSCVVNFDPSY